MFVKSGTLLRNIMVNNVKRCSHGGMAGENLPFGKSLGRPGKLTLLFCLYFGTGFWAPFLILTYQEFLK
ncbi:hypothetical protein NQ318_014177 [Aromia moschata]|uniref:Cytochrome c oxidase polypeptide VIIc n=1 Tax=Aromia moschata TaxID=1265417 RepID=A0AAV8Y8K2_9CUCU|nr:hypothetical protein NQ318_014177 [Aromia moschata]